MTSQFFYRFVAKKTYLHKLILKLGDGESKVRELCKEIGISFQHMTNILQAAHQEGIIKRETVKNRFEITLTEKGRVLMELCKGITMVIEDWKDGETQQLLSKLNFLDEKSVVEDKPSEEEEELAAVVKPPVIEGDDENEI